MNNDMNNGQGFGGGQGLNYNPGNGMNQMGMQQPVMQQQPIMQQAQQQPMFDPQTGQPLGGGAPMGAPMAPNAGGMGANNKKVIMLIPAALIGIIVIVLLFNVIFGTTLSCKYSYTDNDDVKHYSYEKEKFMFGKPTSAYSKTVTDYSKADVDKDEVKDKVKTAKEYLKEFCKKKDGCSYSIKQSGKKVTLIMKQKYDKDDKEDWKDEVDSFKDYKSDWKDDCKETKEKIKDLYD